MPLCLQTLACSTTIELSSIHPTRHMFLLILLLLLLLHSAIQKERSSPSALTSFFPRSSQSTRPVFLSSQPTLHGEGEWCPWLGDVSRQTVASWLLPSGGMPSLRYQSGVHRKGFDLLLLPPLLDLRALCFWQEKEGWCVVVGRKEGRV